MCVWIYGELKIGKPMLTMVIRTLGDVHILFYIYQHLPISLLKLIPLIYVVKYQQDSRKGITLEML